MKHIHAHQLLKHTTTFSSLGYELQSGATQQCNAADGHSDSHSHSYHNGYDAQQKPKISQRHKFLAGRQNVDEENHKLAAFHSHDAAQLQPGALAPLAGRAGTAAAAVGNT